MSVSYFGLRTSVVLGRNSKLLSHILYTATIPIKKLLSKVPAPPHEVIE
jgi:hypothetical protein